MTFTNEQMFDFEDGNGPVPAHRHSNGGGWVGRMGNGMTIYAPQQEGNTMRAISSNHYSHDLQVGDVLDYLRAVHLDALCDIAKHYPEINRMVWDGAWLDTEAMGVDPEFSSWLADAIEDTGLVSWIDGEPFAGPFDDEEES